MAEIAEGIQTATPTDPSRIRAPVSKFSEVLDTVNEYFDVPESTADIPTGRTCYHLLGPC